jgi:hypothetical protein
MIRGLSGHRASRSGRRAQYATPGWPPSALAAREAAAPLRDALRASVRDGTGFDAARADQEGPENHGLPVMSGQNAGDTILTVSPEGMPQSQGASTACGSCTSSTRGASF